MIIIFRECFIVYGTSGKIMSNKTLVRTVFVSLLLLSGNGFSSAQVAMTTRSNSASTENFSQFIPRPQKKTQIDYDVWNSILEEMVLYTGPSARIKSPHPKPITGSRLIRGHKSAYRLEGNRIPYSQIKSTFESAITEYREDLERVGTNLDISKLPKNEQLAFWFNLHNVVIIEQLTKEYPVKRPKDLKIGKPKVLLHDAKIININNMQLSLRDIREKIVYPNWSNSIVLYGFYLGDIGSPSIQNTAFNADNINDLLDRSANEFVNSLRGFHVRNNKQYVSQLYVDVAKFYFPNFNRDVEAHIKKYMRDDVKSQILTSTPYNIDRYHPIIADLTAGQGNYESISQLRSTTASGSGDQLTGTDTLQLFVNELLVKRKKLKRLGLINDGTVTIDDIETTDPDSQVKPDIE